MYKQCYDYSGVVVCEIMLDILVALRFSITQNWFFGWSQIYVLVVNKYGLFLKTRGILKVVPDSEIINRKEVSKGSPR